MTKTVKKCNIIAVKIHLKEIIMDALKKFFPHAFKAIDVKAFIISLIIYVLIDVVCGFVIGLLALIPMELLIINILVKQVRQHLLMLISRHIPAQQ